MKPKTHRYSDDRWRRRFGPCACVGVRMFSFNNKLTPRRLYIIQYIYKYIVCAHVAKMVSGDPFFSGSGH